MARLAEQTAIPAPPVPRAPARPAPAAPAAAGPQIAAAPVAPAADALAGRLARAVLQRSPDTAAQALKDAEYKTVNRQQLMQWLNKSTRLGDEPHSVKNSARHKVAIGDLETIRTALDTLIKAVPKPVVVVEEAEAEGHVRFPHNGKHQPPPKLAGLPREIAEETGKKNAESLYISNNAETVIALETEAIEHGLTLSDNFTIVYRFEDEIGADGGELTRCIRMEGTHHGHPIRESGSKQSFDSYVKKDVGLAKNDAPRKAVIKAFLEGLALPPRAYGLT
jgi:hypothetical protein